MNLVAIAITFLAYSLFVAMYNQSTSEDAPDFPTFSPPSVDFENVPSSCDGFLDCTEFIGKVIINIVLGVVYVVLLIVEIIRLLVEIATLILVSSFAGIEGVPTWFNTLVVGCFAVMTIVVIYKSVRKGDTDSA
jgi:hypothetical protein